MKYIIELEDEPMIANSFHQEVDELWKAKGFNSLVFDQNGIKKLTPYTEPDRKAVEDEVWKFCMNTDWSWISEIDTKPLSGYTYQEAKAKYEAWKRKKDEIKVGDEVVLYENIKMIVVQITNNREYVQGIDEDGECYESIEVNSVKKTGRHFDEVEELLKKIRGEE